jgi:DNA-binding IscR family transcriptional regulator
MKRDSRLSSVLHALLHMAASDHPMTSGTLAACMGTNPVVVRRTMAGLRAAGFVRSEKGHGGGWTIACDLGRVTLRDVHEALGEPALFAVGNRNEAPQCLVEQSVNAALNDAFEAAEALLMQRFGRVTLAALAKDFSRRLAALKKSRKEMNHVA